MSREPFYTRAEQRIRMRDFERRVRAARKAWRSGQAYVILSYREYLDLTKRRS